ncbi:hypothetical protein PRNP1_006737 [Phytophthora ramorum]
MSSPLEPREGVDVLSNPRSTRPFTAPDARGGDLLTVLVHFGRHLDTLLPRDTQPALDSAGVSTATGERLNTVNAEDLPASTPSYPEGRVLYEQKCSPYAATRVVEGSTSPSWNELLAVPLPSEWPHTLSRGQHPPDQRPAALDTTHLALKLELVERGASHQEDFLLASCVLPLAKIACQLQQRRFALAFPTGGTPEQVPPACIYVSLQASSRSQVSNANALDQVEVTVESFTPVVATGSEDEGMPVDGTKLLAEPSSTGENKQSPQHEQPQQHQQSVSQLNFIESTETGALLREQLAHLQAEGTAQRVQIERLQNDLDTRLAAIQTCGLEIVALRREARQKDEQLQNLKEQVDAAQRREQQQLAELLVSTTSNGMAFPTRPEQQAASQRFTLLASKYKELDQEYKGMKQQLVDAQRTVASYASLETRHAKLQEAHLVQGALVQRLQRDKQHAAALKKAVRMQEKVIRQFEQTVAQQSAEVPERPSPRQLAPGTEQLDADSGDSETREALLRIRVRVLEQQLQTNARTAATEMSALRMRILELESRRSGK